MSREIPHSFRVARARLSNARPYFNAALWACPVVVSESVPTAAMSDTGILTINPTYVETLDCPSCAGLIYHELWHWLRRHGARRGSREPLPWNVAADCEINDGIKPAGTPNADITLPPKGVTPTQFGMPAGRLAEWYYDKLPKTTLTACVCCGSAAGNGPSGETGKGDDTTEGDADAPQGIPDDVAAVIERKVAREVQEAAKTRGTIPAGLQRWADAVLDVRLPWQRLLRGALREVYAARAGMVDYTYRRPNRRQAAYGAIIIPTLYAPLPRVALVVDTSGSMDKKDLEEALAICYDVFRSVGVPTVDAYSIDAKVHTAQRLTSARQLKLAGGGGTDMRVGIDAALAGRPRPSIIVCVTDCFTPWPDERTPVPLVVAVTSSGQPESVPEWARVVVVGG